MKILNLIFTRHYNIGNCNSKELLKIIESINPDVIFEELEKATFNRIYKENKQTTLETDAIKKHLNKQDIPHIPVDTLPRPLNFYENCKRMRNKISGATSRDAFDYRNSIDNLILVTNKYGFDFLNSDTNDKLLQEIDVAKEKVLKTIGDKKLHHISTLENKINEKREDEILNNIYTYCKHRTFNQAIVFIGSGHRKSILKKIEERSKVEDIKLNWQLLKRQNPE
ncbi:hypothetical protein [Aquimarina sp. 2201CG5-10]|uniref:hypothetical protein n=1 Tax=Aquimarina callyspongiae TaxID=3098150 RepID=UPI002AB34146|nr:hypothetical protein [Aquimarina sp. 2201CG5-10]MDY8137509.1 hypothetical protein [Aquimarina sp. 2201CG5-10]